MTKSPENHCWLQQILGEMELSDSDRGIAKRVQELCFACMVQGHSFDAQAVPVKISSSRGKVSLPIRVHNTG